MRWLRVDVPQLPQPQRAPCPVRRQRAPGAGVRPLRRFEGKRSRPVKRVRPISTLVVAWIAALALSDARAEQPLSLFLLPPLLDDLTEMVVPFQVNSGLGPNQGSPFWIVESRYCGASADRAGKFRRHRGSQLRPRGQSTSDARCRRLPPRLDRCGEIVGRCAPRSALGCGRFSARGLEVLSPAMEVDGRPDGRHW